MSKELKVNAVTKDKFMALQRRSPRRMRLTSSRFLTRCEKGSPWHGKCAAPFMETAGPLFEGDTGFRLHPNEFGAFRSVQSEEEFNQIGDWVKRQGVRVFIRALLPVCVALDLNFEKPGGSRTEVGGLEYAAKRGNNQAKAELGARLARGIRDMSIYAGARFIAAVPPLRTESSGLAADLVRAVADELKIVNLTGNFFRRGDAPQVKGMAEGDKWDGVEKAGLILRPFPENLPGKGESVILLDDKYQSGTTMHYAAMRMQAAGIQGPILGLVAVKTLRDDDNTQRHSRRDSGG